MFHVGQKVHCTVNGGGTIEEIDAGIIYPVKVQLDCGDFDFYTEDGRLREHQDVKLFPADSNAFLQDLKQLLQRYNASIEAFTTTDYVSEIEIRIDGVSKYEVSGGKLDVDFVNELIQKP